MVISMERWKGKVAVVTGASSGIGAAVAEQLVEEGLQVVGLARRKERIDELAKKLQSKSGKLYGVKADVSKEEDVIQAFKWTKDNLGPVHILINCAGFLRNTNLIDGQTKLWKEIMDTNVLGLCMATREAVKDMRANNVNGHIIHINSIGGHKVAYFPQLNVYAASKYAVTALTETLRQELNSINSKIKVTSISPGIVATEIRQASSLPLNANYSDVPSLEAKDCADAILYALATPPHVQIHELIIKPVGEAF